MGRLEGKRAVVTGSTHGLGLAIARAFAREGAAVILCGRTAVALEHAVRELQASGRRTSGIVADVGDLADVKQVTKLAVKAFGGIDVWVNNAGVAGVFGPTAAVDPSIVERVVRTNILGVYYGSVVAIQQFQAQESGGKLINLLGRGDRQPVPLQNAYAPTKAWVRSFTRALVKEYAHQNIGIYLLNPGLVDTQLLRDVTVVRGFEERVKPLATVMRLWANPPEVPAEVAIWLASSATDGRTGVEKQVLTAPHIVGGLLREAIRQLRRRPVPEGALQIHAVEPYDALVRQPTQK